MYRPIQTNQSILKQLTFEYWATRSTALICGLRLILKLEFQKYVKELHWKMHCEGEQ